MGVDVVSSDVGEALVWRCVLAWGFY